LPQVITDTFILNPPETPKISFGVSLTISSI
jgi:hypothetical protein